MAGQVFSKFIALALGSAGLAGCAAAPVSLSASLPAEPATTQALMGSTPQILSADFGAPLLRRTDGPVQVWVYQSSVCGLQVFLYPDAGGTPRVAAAVPDNGNQAACVQSFARPVTTDAALERPSSS